MTDPISLTLLVLSIAMTIYKIVSAPKPKPPRTAGGNNQVSGVDVIADGQPAYIPLVYGKSRVAGVRAYTSISPSFTAMPLPTGYEYRFEPRATTSASAKLTTSGAARKNSVLTTQIAIAHGPINSVVEVLLEDTTSDNPNFAYRSNNTVHKDAEVKNRLPEASWQIDVSCAGGIAHPRGSSTAKFYDIANATATFKIDEFVLQWNGIPEASFLVEGLRVQKWVLNSSGVPILGAFEYSNNPAWCLLDYLTSAIYGKGIDVATEIDVKTFIAAAAVCDQPFLKADGTVELFDIGGAVNAPNGILQAPRQRAIFECNVTLDTSKPMRDNIDTLLTTMNGAVLTWSNGQYRLLLVHPRSQAALTALRGNTAITTLTDYDLVLDQEIDVAWPDASTRLNQVTVHFKNEARNFKDDAITWPVLYQDAEIPVAATSDVLVEAPGSFVWARNANNIDYSDYAFVGMFERFGVFCKGAVTGATDVYHIHRTDVPGSYSFDVVCTGRITSVKVFREFPLQGLPEQLLLNMTTCATPKFYNDEKKVDDSFGTGFYYNTLVGDLNRPIGYQNQSIGSGATRLTLNGQEAKLNILANEDMYLRIEIAYNDSVSQFHSLRDSTVFKEQRKFSDYNPDDGVVYGLSIMDYSAGHKVLWETGQQYYAEFKIASPNEAATLVAAKALQDQLKADDGNVLLERDYTIPGVSTLYHAWFRAEELVRSSRFSFKVTFQYLVRNVYIEPGDVFAIQSDTMGWPTPIILRATSSSLNEENVCTVSADYISMDLYIQGVNLPGFKHSDLPPIYLGVASDIKSFIFESAANTTVGSPGTLRYSATQPNLVKGFEIAACYDNARATDGTLSFVILAPEVHSRDFEVPPTVATAAIFRIRAISYNDVKGTPAYSLTEGSHTLSKFGNLLILTCDQDAVIYTDDKPGVTVLNLKALLDTDLQGKVYTWKVNNVVQTTMVGNEVTYTLPSPQAGQVVDISVTVTDTDAADLAFVYTDSISIPLLKGVDSAPLLRFADALVLLEKDKLSTALPKAIDLQYFVKGKLTELPSYTLTGVGCTVVKVTDGVSITAVDEAASSIYITAVSGSLSATTKLMLITNTTFNVSVTLRSEDKLVAKYDANDKLDPQGYSIAFTADLNVPDLSLYTFTFYVDDVVNPNSIGNSFIYYPKDDFINMPETVKVSVSRTIAGVVRVVAVDYVTIIGLQASNTDYKLVLTNPFQVLTLNLDKTTNMELSGTYGDVYRGLTKLEYSTTDVNAINAVVGTYNITATQVGLSGLSTVPISANSTSDIGFHTASYPAMLATTNEATITFTAVVKLIDSIVTLPISKQTLLRQTSFAATKVILDAAQMHQATFSDDVSAIPNPVQMSITYMPDADDDGTTEGNINWKFAPNPAQPDTGLPPTYTNIDGFVVCYTTTKLNQQLDLTHLDVVSSAVYQQFPKEARTYKVLGLGTTRYVCAFMFAYRKISMESYTTMKAADDASPSGKITVFKTPDNFYWAVSDVVRSHTVNALSKYTDRLVLQTDFKDAAGNLIPMASIAANLEDFNAKNNDSTAPLLDVYFDTPGITYDNTKVNSGNIDFFISCYMSYQDLTDVDGIAVFCKEFPSAEAVNTNTTIMSAADIAKELTTVFINIDENKKEGFETGTTNRRWTFKIPFDEMKVNVFRNVFIFAYREVDAATYKKTAYAGLKFTQNKRTYFCSSPRQLIPPQADYSIYNGTLTTSAHLKLPDGTAIDTAELYANLIDTRSSNNNSVAPLSVPVFSTSTGIVYTNAYSNSGNIDFLCNFGSINKPPVEGTLANAEALNVDTFDGFALVEVLAAEKTLSIYNINADSIMKDPNNVVVKSDACYVNGGGTAQSLYAVEFKESKAKAARTIFAVAYREVFASTYKKDTTNTKVTVGNRYFFCSPVARSHANGDLSFSTLPLTTTAFLQTAAGNTINTTLLYENYIDFNVKNNSSTERIVQMPANMVLSYSKDTDPTTIKQTSVYPSGNVDITFEFDYNGPTDRLDANAIDGFCVLLADSKTNTTIAVPTYEKMFKNPNSKFISATDPVVNGKYAVVFKDISPTPYRTAFVFPYREVISSAWDKYDTPLVRTLPDTVALTPQFVKFKDGKNFICAGNTTPLRSHANNALYQAMNQITVNALVATAYGDLSLSDSIGDFNLGSADGLMGDTSVIPAVDKTKVLVKMAGNKSGTLDITLTWEYNVADEVKLDGFIIDTISTAKATGGSKATITKLKGYITTDESSRSHTFLNQAVKAYYNFTIIPYHVISETTFKKASKVTGVKTRVARVGKVPIVFESTYDLIFTPWLRYAKQDTQGAVQPTLSTAGDYWLNTSAATVAGVPSLQTAQFDGDSWEPLTTEEYVTKGITQTVEWITEPPWKVGFTWKNTSTETIAGIVRQDTATWDSKLSIWKSSQTKPMLHQYVLANLNLYPPAEGSYYLGTDTKNLYRGSKGVWQLAAEALSTAQIGTSKPSKGSSQLVFFDTKQLVFYKRAKANLAWNKI
jgi:hypothetical protein